MRRFGVRTRVRIGAFLSLGLAVGAVVPASDVTAQTTELTVPGLGEPVEIIVDRWGISHIYAGTEADLFFAQGWNAARDRLFQLELWRRQATGTVAEILGPRELERDVGTRLFMFRRDVDAELAHYHPRGRQIVEAFVRGINAYIAETERDPSLLTVEFELLGIRPGRWTPEVVISRHQGLLGNIGAELNYGRIVTLIGEERLEALSSFGPGDPDLRLDPAIDRSLLFEDILGIYDAFRGPVRFRPEDIVEEHRASAQAFERLEAAAALASSAPAWDPTADIGSNNWVVGGRVTESGYPMMANDPHRAQAAPSLRYWVHLVGPGWNVIGGGEPSLPGVSIGHNEFGAWGLTVFQTDGEDLYVYETDPADPNRYRYADGWERMTVIRDTIRVKGQAPYEAELKYTRHGPVVYEDPEQRRAYAVRAAWMEIGGAPYLASLRMDQARTWEEFRDACNYSHIPGENMVWADRDGNIGWQSVGIAPIRRNWSGLVPVPGDGRYEWDGYLPINEKPHVYNPPEGYFATANNDLIPRDYEHMDAIGFEWSAPFRWSRIHEVLASGRKHSLVDMMRLQTDELSLPARRLVPLLRDLELPGAIGAGSAAARVVEARGRLLEWDFVLDRRSVAAGIYVAWEAQLRFAARERMIPEEARPYMRGVAMTRLIDWLTVPPAELGSDPVSVRNELLLTALEGAVTHLTEKLGPEMAAWQYGQEAYKHALLRHPLGPAVDEVMRRRLEVGPAPRGGYGLTVNNTGNGDNQTSGASFRIVVDTDDWDRTVGMNAPGQSGDPDSPHYRDLFGQWVRNEFHPIVYSRDRVEAAAGRIISLAPER